MVDKLNDNGNEVLRGAGEIDTNGLKYNLRTIASGNTSAESVNSSIAPLGIGETFTGTGELNGFSQVGVTLKTDAKGTLFFDFSPDGTNWDSTYPVGGFIIDAGITEFHTAVKLGRYFRVRLVNDGTAQTYLRLNTYYGENFVPSTAPLNQSLGIDQDATVSRPNDFTDEVVLGRRAGVTHFAKFGYRSGLTANLGEQTIWSSTGNFVPMTSAETFTITYTQATDGLGTTGALALYIQYIDADGLDAIAVHTLSNTGSDVTSFTGLGINRVAVSLVGTATFNTNAISLAATTAATIQAGVPATLSVTQQAIYHADSNSDAIAKYLWFNINKISGGGSPRVTVKGYVYNRQFGIRFEVFRETIDTGVENTVSINEPVGFKLSPTDILYFTADTNTNDTAVGVRFSLLEYKRN